MSSKRSCWSSKKTRLVNLNNLNLTIQCSGLFLFEEKYDIVTLCKNFVHNKTWSNLIQCMLLYCFIFVDTQFRVQATAPSCFLLCPLSYPLQIKVIKSKKIELWLKKVHIPTLNMQVEESFEPSFPLFRELHYKELVWLCPPVTSFLYLDLGLVCWTNFE